MTPTDRAHLLALARAAADVHQATEERDCAVYYGAGKVPYGKEILVATTHCQEWTKYIEATIPEKIIALLSALEAAERERDAAFFILDHIDREACSAEDGGDFICEVVGALEEWRVAKALRARAAIAKATGAQP